PGAIVGKDKNENSVFFQSLIFDGLIDLTDGPIELHHDIAIETGAGLPFEPVAAKERYVRHGMGQIEEKWLISMTFDKIHCFFGVPGAEHFLMFIFYRIDRDRTIFPVPERPLTP